MAVKDWFTNLAKRPWEDFRLIRRPLIYLIAAAVALYFVSELIATRRVVLDAIYETELKQATLQVEWGKTLGQLLLALGGAISLYYMDRRVKLTEEGNFTERYIKAIELLGATREEKKYGLFEYVPNLELRIGAVHALARLANDSKKDHPTIMDVLAAYVRQNAKGYTDAAAKQEGKKRGSVADLRGDIAAIFQVFAFRNKDFDASKVSGQVFDLHGVNLQRRNLANVRLVGVNLVGARLEGASLEGAFLDEAVLQNARLEGTDLVDAFLEWALLENANMKGARLSGANLNWATLDEANLEDAGLEGTHLEAADLEGTLLAGARMHGAFLSRARFHGAHLEGAIGLTQGQVDSTYHNASTELPESLINRAAEYDPPIEWNPTLNSGKGGLWSSVTEQPVEGPPPTGESAASGGDSPGPEDLKTAAGVGSSDPGNGNRGPGSNPPDSGNDSAGPAKNPPKPPKGPKSGGSKVGNAGKKSPKPNKSKKEG